MGLHSLVLASDPAARLAAWLTLNLIPFSVFGALLAWVGMKYDLRHDRRARLVLGVLVAGLLVSTGITTHTVYAAVVYDPCNDPSYPTWLWWLTCAL